MVVFTCNNCGDSLQKPKVEKHYQYACRNNPVSLTCVDCFKEFKGDEFTVHTKCITEDERYSAKGSFVNGDVKKGDVKQESWLEMIRSILDVDKSLTQAQKRLLETISSYTNVPRKKPKFMNFIKSSSGGRTNLKEAEDVWNIIEKYKNEQAKQTQNGNKKSENNNGISKNTNTETNGTEKISKKKNKLAKENNVSNLEKEIKNNENETKKRKNEENTEEEPKKKKKSKNADENSEVQPESEHIIEEATFNFKNKILEILDAKKSISIKKLQKKVLNAYLKNSGETECSEKLIKKFNKKLKKLENVQIDDTTVTLLESENV